MDRQTFLETIEILFREYEKWDAPAKAFETAYERTPFRILCATLLSFRTKDEVTLQAALRLFEHIDDPKTLAAMRVETIEGLIYPVGFYRKKARTLKRVAQILTERFDGEVPDDMERLVSIEGIGPKTAAIVLESAFKKPIVAVDTHVHRLVRMWGVLETRTPEETAAALDEMLPEASKRGLNRVLVSFGQTICRPNAPRCEACPVVAKCEARKNSPKSDYP